MNERWLFFEFLYYLAKLIHGIAGMNIRNGFLVGCLAGSDNMVRADRVTSLVLCVNQLFLL